MGAVNSADIDNTNGLVSIFSKKRKQLYEIVKNQTNDISIQYLNTNDPHISENLLYERSYMGEISSKHTESIHILLNEAQKISMEIKYKLTDYIENNDQVKRFHGLGHIGLRTSGSYTTVQMCIESLNISEDGIATALYVGYLEKDFKISCSCEVKIDVCVTFMLTFSSPPIPNES